MEGGGWGGRDRERNQGKADEVRQGRKESEKQGGRREGGSEAWRRTVWLTLQTRRCIRAVEFQPDFKTMQAWSTI